MLLKRGGRRTPFLRRALVVLPVWVISSAWMWSWWLFAAHSRYMPLYIPLTLAMLYEFCILPSLFMYFLFKVKAPKRRLAAKGHKVAVITPCVPSQESLDIVENQLKAMVAITYPHDSWVLDEGGSAEIKKMAKKYGVKYFTRKGVRKYNQPKPPLQKKTKAGNINAWLDHVKWRRYDFFVQLDIDHIPQPNYLNKTLGHFRDEKVAWVQGPSVYGNLEPWTSKGAAEQELVLQGPLQMGFYGHSATPFIIGSHCTYRMSAIRQIGGFQPTRAEDHLDTVHLASRGYNGVFVPEVIATGDGPETLSTYLAQQFAWAYSMFQVLLWHSPKLLKSMDWRRKWQFLFAQTWYPLWSLSYMVLFLSPILALWHGGDIVVVDQGGMFAHFIPLFITSFLIWWSAKPIMQPKHVNLSWRGMILHAARWPIILRALTAAALKVKKPYMITPKGKFAQLAPSIKTYTPFLFLGTLSSLTVIAVSLLHHGPLPEAQMIFAVANSGFMLTICSIDLGLRLKQTKPKREEFTKYWLKPVAATSGLAMVMLLAWTVALLPLQPALASRHTKNIQTQVTEQSITYDMTTAQLTDQISVTPHTPALSQYIGMYNSSGTQNSLTKVNHITHSFADWRDNHYFAYELASTLRAGNTPLVTLEPRGNDNGAQLLSDINSGHYDQRLKNLAQVIKASKSPVYIRFAHEMDLANVYAWGNQDPQSYIEAFKHVRSILKSSNPENLRMVWSPAGNYGSDAYYPGDENVDVVGTTILYDQYWYGYYLPTFAYLASTRDSLKVFNKPVWIVEFGAGNSNLDDQHYLIKDALANYRDLGYSALIYLNMRDANIDGPDYRLVHPNDFADLYWPYNNSGAAKNYSAAGAWGLLPLFGDK